MVKFENKEITSKITLVETLEYLKCIKKYYSLRFLLSMEPPSCINGFTDLHGNGYFCWKLEKCKKGDFLHHSKSVDVIS